MGVSGQLHAPAALLPGKRPATHCIGGWVGPGPVWKDAENLAPTGIRSPDRPACSESLYRLFFSLYCFVLVLPFALLVQHTQHKHAPGGIQTRNPSKRSAADFCLRPLGHWDRLSYRGPPSIPFGLRQPVPQALHSLNCLHSTVLN